MEEEKKTDETKKTVWENDFFQLFVNYKFIENKLVENLKLNESYQYQYFVSDITEKTKKEEENDNTSLTIKKWENSSFYEELNFVNLSTQELLDSLISKKSSLEQCLRRVDKEIGGKYSDKQSIFLFAKFTNFLVQQLTDIEYCLQGSRQSENIFKESLKYFLVHLRKFSDYTEIFWFFVIEKKKQYDFIGVLLVQLEETEQQKKKNITRAEFLDNCIQRLKQENEELKNKIFQQNKNLESFSWKQDYLLAEDEKNNLILENLEKEKKKLELEIERLQKENSSNVFDNKKTKKILEENFSLSKKLLKTQQILKEQESLISCLKEENINLENKHTQTKDNEWCIFRLKQEEEKLLRNCFFQLNCFQKNILKGEDILEKQLKQNKKFYTFTIEKNLVNDLDYFFEKKFWRVSDFILIFENVLIDLNKLIIEKEHFLLKINGFNQQINKKTQENELQNEKNLELQEEIAVLQDEIKKKKDKKPIFQKEKNLFAKPKQDRTSSFLDINYLISVFQSSFQCLNQHLTELVCQDKEILFQLIDTLKKEIAHKKNKTKVKKNKNTTFYQKKTVDLLNKLENLLKTTKTEKKHLIKKKKIKKIKLTKQNVNLLSENEQLKKYLFFLENNQKKKKIPKKKSITINNVFSKKNDSSDRWPFFFSNVLTGLVVSLVFFLFSWNSKNKNK